MRQLVSSNIITFANLCLLASLLFRLRSSDSSRQTKRLGSASGAHLFRRTCYFVDKYLRTEYLSSSTVRNPTSELRTTRAEEGVCPYLRTPPDPSSWVATGRITGTYVRSTVEPQPPRSHWSQPAPNKYRTATPPLNHQLRNHLLSVALAPVESDDGRPGAIVSAPRGAANQEHHLPVRRRRDTHAREKSRQSVNCYRCCYCRYYPAPIYWQSSPCD